MLLQNVQQSVLIDAFAPNNRNTIMRQRDAVLPFNVTFNQYADRRACPRQRDEHAAKPALADDQLRHSRNALRHESRRLRHRLME
ncbi:hypothetical protein D3C84_1095960 [compost metagenome]